MTTKAKQNGNGNNGMSKKTLANIKKQATAFIGGFRAACLAILEVANGGDAEAKIYSQSCRCTIRLKVPTRASRHASEKYLPKCAKPV